jgi:hypothetical protein
MGNGCFGFSGSRIVEARATGCYPKDTVEKLCFEKRDDFSCDLHPFSYSGYEGVVDST